MRILNPPAAAEKRSKTGVNSCIWDEMSTEEEFPLVRRTEAGEFVTFRAGIATTRDFAA
jgi:hypothetical protein